MKHVTLKKLAKELNMDRSNFRKYVLAQGFKPVSVRTTDSRGQRTLALTDDEAKIIRELRESQGFANPTPIENVSGFLYLIQLIPELAPNRIKLGFANNVAARLNAHRTTAPTATLIKTWPCKRSWETTAISSITRIECKNLSNEIFECTNLANIKQRGNTFFSIMPHP